MSLLTELQAALEKRGPSIATDHAGYLAYGRER
jgi:hypothetical protein